MWQVEAKKETLLLYIFQNFVQSLEIRERRDRKWKKESEIKKNMPQIGN
jgi:hypothetical protein